MRREKKKIKQTFRTEKSISKYCVERKNFDSRQSNSITPSALFFFFSTSFLFGAFVIDEIWHLASHIESAWSICVHTTHTPVQERR